MSPLLRRGAALAVLALLLAAPIIGVVLPLHDRLTRAQREAEELSSSLARYRRLAGERGDLARQLDLLTGRGQQSGGAYLRGGSDAVVAATLQNMVKAAVARGRGDLRSTQTLPESKEGGFRRIGVRAMLAADLAGVQAILQALEGGRPLLFVDSLDIRARAGPRQPDDTEPVLEVRFDVYGYLAGGDG